MCKLLFDKEVSAAMTVEEFLSKYDPKVQEICFWLRKIVLDLLPECKEIICKPYNISYGTKESRSDKDLIIYIAPLKDSVNLGFYRGVNLQDEKNLLKGTGKYMRHLKIKSINDVEIDEIKKLILEAKMEKRGSIT